MKKFAFLLAVALPVCAFTSCGDDDDPESLSISSNTVEVAFGAQADLTANSPEANTSWTSSDPFVATYKDGKVVANHVGTCEITASWNGETKTCKVTVNPTNNDFTMPVITWGADVAAVKAAVKGFQLDETNSTDNELRYYTNVVSFTLPAYQYLFNGEGYTGLYSSNLLIEEGADLANVMKIQEWLKQYYNEKETEEDIEYVNGQNETICVLSALIDAEGESTDTWAAIWTAPATKAGQADLVKASKAAALRMVKK